MNTKPQIHFLLFAVVSIVPGLAMMMAHWFPWRAVLGRDLGRLECYTWGTAWITGTAGAVMRLSDRVGAPLGPGDSARAMETAALSAGVATIAAYALDLWSDSRRTEAQRKIAGWKRRAANAA